MSNAKQTLLQSMETQGWHLSADYLDEILQEKPNISLNDLIKTSLNSDLKTIGKKCLPDGIMNGKSDCLEGPCILQVVKVRNIAAPKENETSQTAPPFFKVTLTDGVSNCNALVMDDIPNLNLDTAPGTKFLLKGTVKTKSSSLILNNQTCQVLGGLVDYLYNKWKQAKEISQHVRGGAHANTNGEGAPPPWVPFGTKQTNIVDTSKKTLNQVETTEDTTSEFSIARQAALSEAMQDKLKINKTFIHQTVDKPTEQYSNTYQDKQTSFVVPPSTTSTALPSTKEPFAKRGGKFRNRDRDEDDERGYKEPQSKPSTFTLFDAVKQKLTLKDPSNEESNKEQQATYQNNSNISPPHQQQSSNQSSNYKRNNNNNINTNDNQLGKERKPHLPPRFQRANDEKERNYTQNNPTNINNTNNNNSRRGPNKYSDNNNYSRNNYQQQQTTQPAYDSDDFLYDLNANKLTDTSKKLNNTTTNKSQTQQAQTNSSNNNNDQQIEQQQQQNYENNNYKLGNNSYDNNNNNNSNNKNKKYNNNKYNNNNNNNRNNYDYNQNDNSQYVNTQPQQPYYYTHKPQNHKNQQNGYYQIPPPPPQQLYQQNIPLQYAYAYNTPIYAMNNQQYDGSNYFTPVITGAPIQLPTNPPQLAHVQAPPPLPLPAAIPVTQIQSDQTTQQYDSKQSLNSGNDSNNNNTTRNWKKGDQCLAKYVDNKYYPAYIEDYSNGAQTCVVSYIGYNENGEVKLVDLKPCKDNRSAVKTK